MRSGHRTKKKANWAARIVVVALAAFLFLKLVQVHMQLQQKSKMINQMNENIATMTVINEDLNEQIAHSDDNRERQANEAGWFLSGQQIYQSSAG